MPVSSLFLFTMCSFTKNMHVTTSYLRIMAHHNPCVRIVGLTIFVPCAIQSATLKTV